jgi:hypothetical protein
MTVYNRIKEELWVRDKLEEGSVDLGIRECVVDLNEPESSEGIVRTFRHGECSSVWPPRERLHSNEREVEDG